MTHADELLLASGDAVSDPGSALYLADHLRSCRQCRELQRKVDRADRLVSTREPVLVALPLRRPPAPRPVARLVVAAAAGALVLAGVVAGGALREFRSDEGAPGVGTPETPTLPVVPNDWQLVTVHDLEIPLPPGWTKTIDEVGNSDRPDPASPRILYFEDPSGDRAAARFVSIWIWPTPSVEKLVRERFVEGNLSLVSERALPGSLPTHEVVGVASWTEAENSGQYLARHLFVQVDPHRAVDVIVFGPKVPSTQTEPTAEMRSIGEVIAHHVTALSQQMGCPRTQTADASGVITTDGVTGVVGSTYASHTDINGSFVIVRRGANLADRIAVKFEQIGTSAPASWVAYGAGATAQVSPWGEVVFHLGVKPIAFHSSCWRLIVDGADTDIVLFVGP